MFKVPTIIQGGMGVGISNWRLAQAVSSLGQLGVVSGTALDQVLVRRLADGDPGGAMRRALAAFPFPAPPRRLSPPPPRPRRLSDDFFTPGGKPADQPYPALPLNTQKQPRKLVELCM